MIDAVFVVYVSTNAYTQVWVTEGNRPFVRNT